MKAFSVTNQVEGYGRANYKLILRHGLFLCLESAIASGICCFVLFLFSRLPFEQSRPSNTDYVNIWIFTVFALITWVCRIDLMTAVLVE